MIRCNLAGGFHCLGRIYCLHFQGRNEPSNEGGRLYWSRGEKMNGRRDGQSVRTNGGKKKRGFQASHWELRTLKIANTPAQEEE
jgi:hypothetical protein